MNSSSRTSRTLRMEVPGRPGDFLFIRPSATAAARLLRGSDSWRTGARPPSWHTTELQQGADLGDLWRAIWPMSANRRNGRPRASKRSCAAPRCAPRAHQPRGIKRFGDVIVEAGLEALMRSAVHAAWREKDQPRTAQAVHTERRRPQQLNSRRSGAIITSLINLDRAAAPGCAHPGRHRWLRGGDIKALVPQVGPGGFAQTRFRHRPSSQPGRRPGPLNGCL